MPEVIIIDDFSEDTKEISKDQQNPKDIKKIISPTPKNIKETPTKNPQNWPLLNLKEPPNFNNSNEKLENGGKPILSPPPGLPEAKQKFDSGFYNSKLTSQPAMPPTIAQIAHNKNNKQNEVSQILTKPNISHTQASSSSEISIENSQKTDPSLLEITILELLENSLANLPKIQDSSIISPVNPIPLKYGTCVQYPKTPMNIEENLLKKFDDDTLFFCFYYQQNTYEQYLAGKELKSRGWEYNTQYTTWIQRKEAEKGVIYFDYESWNQRFMKEESAGLKFGLKNK